MKKRDNFFVLQTTLLCILMLNCCNPWPRRIWIDTGIPDEMEKAIILKLLDVEKIEITENREKADVAITVTRTADSQNLGTWFYAAAVPFFSIEDKITFSELKSLWYGEMPDTDRSFEGWNILVDRDTCDALSLVLDIGIDADIKQDHIVKSSDLMEKAWEGRSVISVVPFHKLSPEWKVLRLSGYSLLERNKDVTHYPLKVNVHAVGDKRGVSVINELFPVPLSNRDESKMTIMIMTGVTGLTRQTAWAMEQNGITWPARDIKSIFDDADYVHTSNEVSFIPDYVAKPTRDTLTFASHDKYIELLEYINLNIVEVSGNHLIDYGQEAFLRTLEIYDRKGWQYIGGGKDIHDAKTPAYIVHGPNRIVLLAYSDASSIQFAGENRPGPVHKQNWPELYDTIRRLKNEGWLPVVCVQDWEVYEYRPPATQVEDFRALARAGAIIVQGSQAHQPQAFDLYYGSFIHHGPGNFFFDQMWSLGTRQEFIDKHVFYNGKHISTVLYTAMLEDFARPRFMNEDERKELLSTVFAESWRNEVKTEDRR